MGNDIARCCRDCGWQKREAAEAALRSGYVDIHADPGRVSALHQGNLALYTDVRVWPTTFLRTVPVISCWGGECCAAVASVVIVPFHAYLCVWFTLGLGRQEALAQRQSVSTDPRLMNAVGKVRSCLHCALTPRVAVCSLAVGNIAKPSRCCSQSSTSR